MLTVTVTGTLNPIRTWGHIVPAPLPPVTHLRVAMQIHVGACLKNLTFLNYEFWKSAVHFLPRKIISFRRKK